MPHTLLLADDSVTIQRVIELTFADEDIRVVAVSDGAQAIREAQASPPDIVLADVGMPEMDGYEVAAFIKGTPALSHIPVLLLTGAFEPIDEGRARSVGCDGVLVKPFEPQMVISRVKDLLAGRSVMALPQSRGEGLLPVGAQPSSFAPPPPPATDEYFDRLDAALASFDATAQPAAAAPAASIGERLAPQPDREGRLETSPAHHQTDAPTIITPAPLPEPFLSSPASGPSMSPSARAFEEAETASTRKADSPAGGVPPGPPADTSGAPVGPAVSSKSSGTPSLAEAFEALLAAEQGRPLESAAAQKLAASETLIDHITRQVIERLADERMREAVLDVAERLVREEIDRIRSAAH